MSMPADSRARLRSQKIYERLLAAYPKAHRAKYGAAMSQLFRDQCRDAWTEAQGWGMTKLWLRVLPDLVKTSALEHLLAIKERKFMSGIISALLRPPSPAWHAFRVAFVAAFIFVVGASTLVTFLLPESYASTARVRVERVPINAAPAGQANSPEPDAPYFLQTEVGIIQSTAVLGRVVEQLNLEEEWGKKYNGGMKLSAAFAAEFLRRRISIHPIRNTQLISITAYSEDPREAANLANAITDAYRIHCRDLREKAEGEKSTLLNPKVTSMEVVGPAEPELVPVMPNKPRNIIMGALLGILFGAIIGGASAYIASLLRRNAKANLSGPDASGGKSFSL